MQGGCARSSAPAAACCMLHISDTLTAGPLLLSPAICCLPALQACATLTELNPILPCPALPCPALPCRLPGSMTLHARLGRTLAPRVPVLPCPAGTNTSAPLSLCITCASCSFTATVRSPALQSSSSVTLTQAYPCAAFTAYC